MGSGKVDESSTVGKGSQSSVLPKIEVYRQDVLVESLHLDDSGKFCHFLPPCTYIIKLPESSLANGQSFTPPFHEVELRDEPFFDAFFVQFKANIRGKVICKGPCSDLTVELLGALPSSADSSAPSSSINKQRKRPSPEGIVAVPPTGEFEFSGVSPGRHTIRLASSKQLQDQQLWWEAEEQVVKIVDRDIDGVEFKQLGFKIPVQSTHPANIKYWPDNGKESQAQTLKITDPETPYMLSLPHPGSYQLRVDSMQGNCGYNFEAPTEFTVPSSTAFGVDIRAKSAILSFQISLKNPPKGGLGDDMKVLLRDKIGHEEPLRPLPSKEKTGGVPLQFQFRLDSNFKDQIFTLEPVSKKFLFRPQQYQFSFDGNCNAELVIFEAEEGKFIKGEVRPPVENVVVTATHREDNAMVYTTKTDSQGKYSIGPLWNELDFSVEATLEGYKFSVIDSAKNPHSFNAQKLSQLTIRFVDAQSKEPLPEVLISLSGGPSNFRSSNFTDQSGTIKFIGLAPGRYFMRPILREYRFEIGGSGKDFEAVVEEGRTKEVLFEGQRFAYSIFGKLSTLGGPLSTDHAIRVEAVSEQCDNHQEEENISPKRSEFRLKGLKPGCQYRVSLRDDQGQPLDRTFPPAIEVEMGKADHHGVNFVLLPDLNPEITVFGKIERDEGIEQPPNLRITLTRNGIDVLQEVTVHTPASVFFFTLDKQTIDPTAHFTVSLDRADARRYKLDPGASTAEFSVPSAASTFHHVQLTLRRERRSVDADISKANLVGLLVVMGTTAIFYYKKNLWERFQERFPHIARNFNFM